MEWEFLVKAVLAAGFAVAVIQQILKSNFIPVTFANRYPVPTNIVLSIVASVVVMWSQAVEAFNQALALGFTVSTLTSLAVVAGSIGLIASITYNNMLDKWPWIKRNETKVVE